MCAEVGRRIEDGADQPDQLPPRFSPGVFRPRADKAAGGLVHPRGQLAGQAPPEMKHATLVTDPGQGRGEIARQSRCSVAGYAPQLLQDQAGVARPLKDPLPLRGRLLARDDDRGPDHPGDAIGQEQHHPARLPPQPRPQPIRRELSRTRHRRQVIRHRRLRRLTGAIEPALDRTGAQMAQRRTDRHRVEGTPEKPPLLMAQP